MLRLPIKRKWFEMLASGEKKEEYREIKQYYRTRLRREASRLDISGMMYNCEFGPHIDFDNEVKTNILPILIPVMFINGYSKTSPTFKALCELEIGTGKTEWGAEEGKEYYKLKLLRKEPVINNKEK